MVLIIILAAGASALLCLAAAVGMLAFNDGPFNAAIGRRIQPARGEARSPDARAAEVVRKLEKLGAVLGKGAMEGRRRDNMRSKLVQAGFYSERSIEIFYAIRVLAAFGLGAAAILVAVVLRVPGSPLVLLGVMVLVALGLFAPNLILAQRIGERSGAVKLGLPDAVDLMVVCLEAGGTLSSAMQRVTKEFGDLHPVLAEQFQIMLLEMQAGASRAEALRRLSERAPTDDMRSLVTMLIQSEALGASMGDTMRVFAEEMRRSRMLEAERKAAELPVMMTFPLVLGIFPALMIVIFTPIVIRFVRVLFQVGAD